MPRRSAKKERGVFEKNPGSEIWWIRYYIDGRERREKVGRKKDASDLYKIRKPRPLPLAPESSGAALCLDMPRNRAGRHPFGFSRTLIPFCYRRPV
jgi:hypothetical protein